MEIYVSEFVKLLLIFLRIFAVFFIAPLFSFTTMPQTTRVFIAFIIALLLAFTVDPIKYDMNGGLLLLGFMGFKEVITGFIIGFSIQFVFYGLSFAGQMIGFELGLSIAQSFDPTADFDSNVIGQILNLVGLLVFVLINGHHYVIRALSVSFDIIPLGFYTLNGEVLELLIRMSTAMFIIAVKIAAPIMIALFLLHIASGVLSRIIPQMQVFFVILPLKTGLGFLIIIAIIPLILFVIQNSLSIVEENLYELIRAMGPANG